MIANLNKIANDLDNSGMFEEANEITNVMKRLAQFAPVAQPQAPMIPPAAPPFGAPVAPAVPMPGAMPAAGVPMQPAAPPAPVTTTTKPPYATSAGAQGNPATVDPAEAEENKIYSDAINQINNLMSRKDSDLRDDAEKIYQDTVTKFQNMKRRGRFMNQVQGLRTKYFAAKYNQGPK